jgi:hypothetical protein
VIVRAANANTAFGSGSLGIERRGKSIPQTRLSPHPLPRLLHGREFSRRERRPDALERAGDDEALLRAWGELSAVGKSKAITFAA